MLVHSDKSAARSAASKMGRLAMHEEAMHGFLYLVCRNIIWCAVTLPFHGGGGTSNKGTREVNANQAMSEMQCI